MFGGKLDKRKYFTLLPLFLILIIFVHWYYYPSPYLAIAPIFLIGAFWGTYHGWVYLDKRKKRNQDD